MGADRAPRINGNLSCFLWVILLCTGLLFGCSFIKTNSLDSPLTTINPTSSLGWPDSNPGTPISTSPVSTLLPPTQTPDLQGSPGIPDEPSPMLPVYSRTQYILDAVFNYDQHTLIVVETIRYVNNTAEELLDLVLVIDPNRWEVGFTLLSITWEEGAAIESYELLADEMYITLPDPLALGEAMELTLSYSLDIPPIASPVGEANPRAYGYSRRQTNIVDWYFYVPPYRPGEGWLVHPRWAFGERQVYEASDFQVRLSLEKPVENLVIAASAAVEIDGDAYTYRLEGARTFALSASDQYQVNTTRVGDVDIYSYNFPFDEDAGQEVLKNTADAVELFSQLIMPYPYSSFSVVEADFLDGMEFSGLFFLSHGFYDLYDGTPRGYLTFIAAHETAHQWWYGLVGNDQALEPWLDEALCTYMEYIFYENVYTDDPSISVQKLLDWWWYYRVNFYAPQGWVDGTIYNFTLFRPYRDSIYLHGAEFISDLRILIGDEAFFAFLREYAHQYAYKIASAPDFFTLLGEFTDQDLDELMAKYFQTQLASPRSYR